ncbi:MAG: IS200/IS605 family transposase [Clostridium sp.]
MNGYKKRKSYIKYHIIRVTKYRYKVLNKNISVRLRELIRQGCEPLKITIIRGSIGKDHVHMIIRCNPSIVPSRVVKYIKLKSSKLIQDEFPELKKRYWGQHLWLRRYFSVALVGE